jgi:hypothetical protein
MDCLTELGCIGFFLLCFFLVVWGFAHLVLVTCQ